MLELGDLAGEIDLILAVRHSIFSPRQDVVFNSQGRASTAQIAVNHVPIVSHHGLQLTNDLACLVFYWLEL